MRVDRRAQAHVLALAVFHRCEPDRPQDLCVRRGRGWFRVAHSKLPEVNKGQLWILPGLRIGFSIS